MRETTALTRTFDSEDQELINEYADDSKEKFILPHRNWNNIIDDYNSANKKKFSLTPLQCRTIIEMVKKSVPPRNIFKAMRISNAKFYTLALEAQETEERLQVLNAKETLTDEEFEEFQRLMRHPVRVLMMDVEQAEGISEVLDWEKFNDNVDKHPEVQFAKMKARFKDYFAEKTTDVPNQNVVVVLGGNFIDNL